MDLENIFSIARTIALNGGRLYLVGGAVRDEIMGLIPSDFDFCVTGLAEEKFMQLFPVAKKAGKYFPVFVVVLVDLCDIKVVVINCQDSVIREGLVGCCLDWAG